MKRGEIRYVTKRDQYGAEMYATGRPAIIVSCDALAATSPVQQVVYLTTQPKRDMPGHVTIHGTGVQSTAICEQVTTVDNTCIGDLAGVCTDDEMLQVSIAIASCLGLGDITGEPELAGYEDDSDDDYEDTVNELAQELTQAKAELAASERFIAQLLDRLAPKGV